MYNHKLVSQLLIGIASLVLGLFLFISRISVSSSIGLHYGSFNLNGGFIILPFLISVIWAIVHSHSFWPKFTIILSIALILLSIIANTHFYFVRESLLNYLMMLGMIAVGLGLIIKVGLSSHDRY